MHQVNKIRKMKFKICSKWGGALKSINYICNESIEINNVPHKIKNRDYSVVYMTGKTITSRSRKCIYHFKFKSSCQKS